MLGYVEFKSHVIRRNEKGVFGIPFKRLLGCGLGAGALLTLLRTFAPEYAVLIALASFGVMLALTAPHGGIARYKHILYSVRWWLLTSASLAPRSVAGQVARALGVPGEGIDIDAGVLFSASDDAPRTQLSDWVSFTKPLASAGDTLSFETSPGLVLQGSA